MNTSTTTLPYRIGEPDGQCRYPVIVGENQVIGHAYRWHRDWLTVTSAGETNLRRPAVGQRGVDMAAAAIIEDYAAGRITAVPLAEATATQASPDGRVPLLDPRMPATARNAESARKALAGLAAHSWTPFTGFPGSDNPWFLHCELCGWEGPRYWSHLRGRNGNPPSASRHPGGCIGEAEVRRVIAAYQA
ncbi:hypothetical protein EDD99_8118 [Streptomyces sp. 846.5]|nr:hypothetical protein [Streptomyces sp. 846.5]TDT93309.1 hypothetical protein EDD99_8118 [Streptomyces sp. 846.5]